MAFGDGGLKDDFNRANDSNLGASWATFGGFGEIAIISNQAGRALGSNVAEYWVTAFGAQAETWVTLAALPGSGLNVDLMLLTDPAGWDAYAVEWTQGSGCILYRADNGVITQLGATVSQEWSANDQIGLTWSTGGTLGLWRKPSGGAVSQITTRSDNTYTGTKNGAIFTDSAATRFEDFGGGVYTPSAGGSGVPRFMAHYRRRRAA